MTAKRSYSGFSLIELLAVIFLLSLLTSFFIGRLDFDSIGSSEAKLKDLEGTLRFLLDDSKARGVTYELEFLSDGSQYRVLQVLPLEDSGSIQVDYLKNFRSDKEKDRRLKKQLEESLNNLDEEYRKAEAREGLPLEELYYARLFSGDHSLGRKIPPLEKPSLAEIKTFPSNVQLNSITRTLQDRSNQDIDSILIPPNPSNSEFNIVFDVDNQKATISIDIFSRSVESTL